MTGPPPLSNRPPCWFCRAPAPEQAAAGWEVRRLATPTVARWQSPGLFGGVIGNTVSLPRGDYPACPSCSPLVAAKNVDALRQRRAPGSVATGGVEDESVLLERLVAALGAPAPLASLGRGATP